ncbi:MAG: lipopolysaccharide assembly protein LapB [Gammaproteobacteria bacterium]|nr:lipopolysaccharide assembly protein LapB [Gammaproteobacteria bacterium]MCI0590393.1 lipopolysaccharide assembly protein LapB [Gammaproteobacteria bacterium]
MFLNYSQLVWFLLPIAAASGWWLARRNARTAKANTGRPRISPDYFKGLNYLLNEQPDKAIEVFIKMLDVDSETVETHLALGNLFRRRGEVDRAIRIHQNLIARPTLNGEQRCLALLELGMDYMRSGLLDRAESLFQELIQTRSYTVQALTQLLEIYQQEKDWDKAIDTARRLESSSGERLVPIIAQFYCEKAEELRQGGQEGQASDMVRRALSVDAHCVRASLLDAELAVKAGKPKLAIRAYKRIEKQDPDFLPEAIYPLVDCFRELGKLDELMVYLESIVVKHGGITPTLALAELIAERHGEGQAIAFITDELRRRPSVRGVNRLIKYALAHAEGATRDNLLMIKDLTGKLLESKATYKCNHCGFAGKSLHWQCPSCKYWNSAKPIHGVEGE